MNQAFSQLPEIREVVERLLDELNIEAYLYAIEPGEQQCELTIECAFKHGWETIKLKANRDYFQHGANDAVIHNLLLNDWREALSDCIAKQPQPE